jgi:hypothetical protein
VTEQHQPNITDGKVAAELSNKVSPWIYLRQFDKIDKKHLPVDETWNTFHGFFRFLTTLEKGS